MIILNCAFFSFLLDLTLFHFSNASEKEMTNKNNNKMYQPRYMILYINEEKTEILSKYGLSLKLIQEKLATPLRLKISCVESSCSQQLKKHSYQKAWHLQFKFKFLFVIFATCRSSQFKNHLFQPFNANKCFEVTHAL